MYHAKYTRRHERQVKTIFPLATFAVHKTLLDVREKILFSSVYWFYSYPQLFVLSNFEKRIEKLQKPPAKRNKASISNLNSTVLKVHDRFMWKLVSIVNTITSLNEMYAALSYYHKSQYHCHTLMHFEMQISFYTMQLDCMMRHTVWIR